MVTAIDDALKANLKFAAGFAPPTQPPRPKLALVLCMDARIDPIRALGLPKPAARPALRSRAPMGPRVGRVVREELVSDRLMAGSKLRIVVGIVE